MGAIIDAILLGIGLAMDAFAVSVCKGLSVKKANFKHMVICGIYFGGFQALMPLIGYLFGQQFAKYITSIDHWITFILLALIGANMIKESLVEAEEQSCSFCPKAMLPLAVATSIDALAVGVGFAFSDINVIAAVISIGVITFIMSAVGVKIGNLFGTRFKSKAELAGGIILIAMGIKFLVEGLMETAI